jgi:hypothetical protein
MAKRGTVHGHFSPTPKLNKGEGDPLAEQPGKDVSKEVYGNDDNPAYRGTRKDTGT